jgi:CRISPR-associated protein Cas2
MYVIIVYDIEEKRVNKVCQYLRRYLNWVQNSAFEGEISEAQLERVKLGLKDIMDLDKDSVYLYIMRDVKWMTKEILGQTKGRTENIL